MLNGLLGRHHRHPSPSSSSSVLLIARVEIGIRVSGWWASVDLPLSNLQNGYPHFNNCASGQRAVDKKGSIPKPSCQLQ